jgi:hypothetical protein
VALKGAQQGGLEVYVTAVDAASGIEYSLYVEGETFDCARTELKKDATTGALEYVATFSALYMSSSTDLPPFGPGSRASDAGIGPGSYRLKFCAMVSAHCRRTPWL